MSFYDYYGEERPEPTPPKGVYAVLDSTNPDVVVEGEKFLAFFEAVEYDLGKIDASSISTGILDDMVSVLEIEISPPMRAQFEDIFGPDDNRADLTWISVLFDDDGEIPVNHYLNLFAPPVRRNAKITIVEPLQSQHFNTLFSIDDEDDSSEEDIKNAIGSPSRDGAAVYDVGQGNCNEVLDGNGLPTLYFDFGGGLLGHTNTYPSGLSDLCFTQNPCIVLSHWDWDHWSSAKRTRAATPNANAIAASWIVPRQRLGPVHRGFFAQLHNVLIWPNSLLSIASGHLAVHKCNGPKSNRNHSGLVLEFLPKWAQGDGVLFTGDCDYSFLPSSVGSAKDFDAVVVPHHGGRLRQNAVPPRPAGGASYTRYCVSCGMPNRYGHPDASTITAHIGSGWNRSSLVETHNRSATAFGPAGHIWIEPRQAVPLVPKCNFGICQTQLVQA